MATPMNTALMGLTRRAERNDRDSLVATFVNVGSLLTLVASEDHQVLYGRRGTGKTHVLQYLAESRRGAGDVAVYIDMRTIGSTGGIYADASVPLPERGTRLLTDTLTQLHDSLMTEVLGKSYASDNDFTAALISLDKLGESLSDVRVSGDEEQETSHEVGGSQNISAGAAVSLSVNPSISASVAASQAGSASVKARRVVRGPIRHRVQFGSVSSSLKKLMDTLPGRLWILLDEWSDVPLDLQPLLADLLRRCLLPVQRVTVKIGAIEQRSRFTASDGVGGYVGMELGPDISADIDLDDFMVFGNDTEKAKGFFRELMYKHVRQALPVGLSISDADDFVRQAFSQKTAFEEMVRAAEGVPRDAINIAMIAAQSAGDNLISVPVLRGAARKWYLRDKEKSVEASPEAMDLLHWVIDEVIAGRKARAFLLLQSAGSSSHLINALYDARVLHVIKRGVSAHDQPGVRFSVYALDYGCYVELINTANAPKGLLNAGEDDARSVYVDVPPDDYRSIRRAILDLSTFESRPRVST